MRRSIEKKSKSFFIEVLAVFTGSVWTDKLVKTSKIQNVPQVQNRHLINYQSITNYRVSRYRNKTSGKAFYSLITGNKKVPVNRDCNFFRGLLSIGYHLSTSSSEEGALFSAGAGNSASTSTSVTAVTVSIPSCSTGTSS